MTNTDPNQFTISVPVDKRAQIDFDYDIAKDEQVIVHHFFGNDVLWILKSGIVDIINDELDAVRQEGLAHHLAQLIGVTPLRGH